MINEDILSLIKSYKNEGEHPENDIGLVTIIRDIEPINECNQESLVFTLHQLHIPLQQIENNIDYDVKKFHVISNLSSDSSGVFSGKIKGYLSTNKDKRITDNIVYKATGSTLSKYIEIVDTKLTKKIKVEFRKKYKERPKIIINIDGNYESLYKNYSLFFDSYTEYVEVPIEETESNVSETETIETETTDTETTETETTETETTETETIDEPELEIPTTRLEERTYYTGVDISFNNLKTKSKYPDISIIVIGDTKEDNIETETTETSTTEEEVTNNDGNTTEP